VRQALGWRGDEPRLAIVVTFRKKIPKITDSHHEAAGFNWDGGAVDAFTNRRSNSWLALFVLTRATPSPSA
jgi:hypothetical protein